VTDSAPLRRLARRVHVRAQALAASRRVVDSLPAAIQITVAAVVAYSIAHWGLGHPAPLIAVTATISMLGLTRDARPRRVLENAIGITVGIALSEAISLVIGKGAWQLAIVLLSTMIVARALSANPAFAIAATVQSSLVALLPDPAGGPFTRSLDAVVAGVVALAITALIPRDPRRTAMRDARRLFSVLTESLEGLVDSLSSGNSGAAELALERLRRTQKLVDNWTSSLDTAIAVSRISPWLRRHLPELRSQTGVLAGADLTTRHLRGIARRVAVAMDAGQPDPALAGIFGELQNGIRMLGEELEDRQLAGASRSLFVDLARRLDPHALAPNELTHSVVVVLLRPLLMDLLVATGMPAADARALLPPV